MENFLKKFMQRFKHIINAAQAFGLLGAMATSGFIVGQWYGAQDAREHANSEIQRLMATHREALASLTQATTRAATATSTAATAVESAASAATQAARTATQAAKAAGVKPAAPSDSRAISKSVEQANERLKKP